MGTTRQDIQSSMCAALLTWVSNLNTGLKKPSQAYYSTLGLSLISMLCFYFLSFAHIWRFWRCRSCKWSRRSSGLSAISRRSTGGCMMPAWSKRMNRFNAPVYKAHAAGAGQWCEDSVLYQLQARARCSTMSWCVSIDLMPLDPIKIQLTAANIITGRQAIDVNRSATAQSTGTDWINRRWANIELPATTGRVDGWAHSPCQPTACRRPTSAPVARVASQH